MELTIEIHRKTEDLKLDFTSYIKHRWNTEGLGLTQVHLCMTVCTRHVLEAQGFVAAKIKQQPKTGHGCTKQKKH